MLVDFPLFGGFNRHDRVTFDAEDLINLYMRVDEHGKKGMCYVGTPGLSTGALVKAGTDPSRALYVPSFSDTNMYGAFGASIYKFTNTLVSTLLGTIGTTTGYVSFSANNGGQICIVDGQLGYTYTPGSGVFAQITDAGFPASPLNVAFLDGYFVIPSGGARSFQISALNDGTKWDALDVAQIQAYPGVNVGVGVVNRRLYFFKTDSTEVWYNAGAADFPFRRDNNLIFNFGCAATGSIVSAFGYLFWLARDKNNALSVMMTRGQQPLQISTPAVDDLISTFTNPTDVTAYVYKDDGHIFLVMNFTTDDYTLVYDVTTSEKIREPFWFRMEVESTIGGKLRHWGNCHAYFQGNHYVGDYRSPTLYTFSQNYADNAGTPIKRERTPRHFFDKQYRRLQVKHYQLDLEAGVGAVSGIYADPKVYISISRDGGRTFGNRKTAYMGKIGARTTRAIWRRLGIGRDYVIRDTIYASVSPICILGAAVEYEVLTQ